MLKMGPVLQGSQCVSLTVVAPQIYIRNIEVVDVDTGEATTNLYRGKTYRIRVTAENDSSTEVKVGVHFEIRDAEGNSVLNAGYAWSDCIDPLDMAYVYSSTFTVDQDLCGLDRRVHAWTDTGQLCDGTNFSFPTRDLVGEVLIYDYEYSLNVRIDPDTVNIGGSFNAEVTLTNELPSDAAIPITVEGHWEIDGTEIPESSTELTTVDQISDSLSLTAPSEEGTYEICFVVDNVHY